MELAIVALYILSIDAALVAMSMGVLLPTIFPGFCLGVALALLSGLLSGLFFDAANSFHLVFPISSIVLAALSAVFSVQYEQYVCEG
jgi:callose synthase